MRKLIPLDFASLGFAEFAWLILAGAGLSLLISGMGWRRRFAVVAALVCVLFAWMRLLTVDPSMSAWSRWIGPMVVTPLLVAGCTLFGMLRPRFPAARRSLWAVALIVLTILARPFCWGVIDIVYMLFLIAAIVGFVDEESRLRTVLLRRVGPLRLWMVLAVAFVVFCALAHPRGYGLPAAFGQLFIAWVLYAMFEQGEEMRKYVVGRLAGAPLVMLIILVLSFVMMRTAPGGPYDKDKAVDPAVQKMREDNLGLNDPWWQQFRDYIVKVAWDGDLNKSIKQRGRPVNDIIRDHVVPSAQLGVVAIFLALLIGTVAGIVSGIKANSIFDYGSMTIAMVGLALPTFVVGPFLVLFFSMKLGWFRVAGWEEFPRDLILPAITLALPFAARIARLTRAGMLEIVNQDYVRTARAKGLDEKTIVLRHMLRGALLPVVSFLGPAIAQLLTGSLVVEKIFGVPGLGTEFVNGAINRDYFVAMGLVLFFGSLLILFNLLVDIAYGYLDPRIRHA